MKNQGILFHGENIFASNCEEISDAVPLFRPNPWPETQIKRFKQTSH